MVAWVFIMVWSVLMRLIAVSVMKEVLNAGGKLGSKDDDVVVMKRFIIYIFMCLYFFLLLMVNNEPTVFYP